MATTKEYMQYIEDLLSELNVTSRKMFGEYVLYYTGKVFGGLYDNRFLIKITPSAKKLLPCAEEVLPYDGAKLMLNISDIDDASFLCELVQKTCSELPAPKQKPNKTVLN